MSKMLSSTSKLLTANFKLLRRLLWTVETRGDDLVLREDNKPELRYPHVWLRDNCQCSECFHQGTKSRVINIEQFDFDSHPEKASIQDAQLEVRWSDSHLSQYELSWLLERQFTTQHQKEWLGSVYRLTPRPWTAAQFPHILKWYQFQDVLDKDEVLLQWLESLAVHGAAMLKGVRTELGELKKLASRVAFTKRTNYGETFTVANKPDTSNYAYLSGTLQLHTDLPYYEHKPGVNMLHCIVQDEGSGAGGSSQLVDGLSVCNWLKEHHPHHYWILSTVPVEWEDIVVEDGKPYHSLYRAPVICEDVDGEVWRINWSQPQRGSHFNVPVEQVTPWYKALQVMSQKLNSPECKVSFKMKPGEIFTFNNIRTIHGRTAYEGGRILEGCYMDFDHIFSKIRVLRKQLKAS